MIWEESTNFSSAALGSQHTLLLTKNGRVWSCGNNDYGQLSQEVSRKRPRMLNGNPNISMFFQLIKSFSIINYNLSDHLLIKQKY